MAGTEPIGPGTLVVIAGLSIVISMAKLVYVPLIGMLMIIPGERLGGAGRRAIYCTAVIGASFVAAALWGLETRKLYLPVHGADPHAQLSIVLNAPWAFAVTVLATVRYLGLDWIKQFVGVLGWLDTRLPSGIYQTYPWMLAAAAFLGAGEGRALRLREKAWIAGLCVCSFVLMETALYLIWCKPGLRFVGGTQGRYFIPLAIPALLIISSRVGRRLKLPVGGVVTLYSAVVLYAACARVYERYWG